VAEELARSEAIRLLSNDRKDRLAEVYHAFARRLLEPDDPVVQPDPNAAWDLLSQARDLAKSPVPRARLLFSMGRTSQKAGNFPRSIDHFQAYLKEYPGGADRLAARFHLGESQRQAGQPLQARLTWTDLARDIERIKPADPDKDAQGIRANALAEIPSTFGIPNPPDDTSMNLGVAALQRFLAAYPAHPRAVKSAYQIAATYLARGKSDLALAALSRFLKDDGFKVETDEARRDQAELAMTATFQYAQILQGQQKFTEAIAAWLSPGSAPRRASSIGRSTGCTHTASAMAGTLTGRKARHSPRWHFTTAGRRGPRIATSLRSPSTTPRSASSQWKDRRRAGPSPCLPRRSRPAIPTASAWSCKGGARSATPSR